MVSGRGDRASGEAIRLEPDRPKKGMHNLAWILATCPDRRLRNGPEAVELAPRLADLSGRQDSQYLRTLADAYLETGELAQAKEELQAALELKPQDAETHWQLGKVLENVGAPAGGRPTVPGSPAAERQVGPRALKSGACSARGWDPVEGRLAGIPELSRHFSPPRHVSRQWHTVVRNAGLHKGPTAAAGRIRGDAVPRRGHPHVLVMIRAINHTDGASSRPRHWHHRCTTCLK